MPTAAALRAGALPLLLLLPLLWTPGRAAAGEAGSVHNMRDLQARMYTTLPLNANTGFCFRLHNATHELGCAGWTGGRGLPLTSVDHLEQAESLGAAVLLTPVSLMEPTLLRLAGDPILASRVRGLLVTNYTVDGLGKPSAMSGAAPFPGAAYAPYEPGSYVWNPAGSGLSRERFDFPVVMLDSDSTLDALERAMSNLDLGFTGAMHVADVDGTMTAQGSSLECISEGTCQPLGGHSVWAAMPPLPPQQDVPDSLEPARKGAILVLAQADTDAFLKGLAQGADAPMSGLIALLVAAKLLSAGDQAASYERHLVFAPLAGEPWDYMGSRKFLWDLTTGESTLQPLGEHAIAGVVELGAVGQAGGGVYVHRQRGAAFGDASGLVAALQGAEAGLPVREAGTSNPGIPPSSLMSFLRTNASIPGVVITEYDAAFSNPYFESFLDSADDTLFGDTSTRGVNASALGDVAVLTARALHKLAAAGGAAAGSELQVNATFAREMAAELVGCLLQRSPGLACPLVTDLISVSATYNPLPHYRHVLRTTTKHPQDPQPYVKQNMDRFLWNFLAQQTGTNTSKRCEPDFPYWKPDPVCGEGEVCVGWKYGLRGEAAHGWCFIATSKYVPTHSTRLTCVDCDVTRLSGATGHWHVDEDPAEWRAAHGGWPEDPMWAESDWQSGIPSVRLYRQEPASVQYAVLAAGLSVTALTVLVLWLGGKAYDKHAKRD
eukprot:jgi/Tetstr1/439358/TSEL_027793.t1